MNTNDKLIVNTDGITDAATKLRTVNNNINAGFNSVMKAGQRLESNWNSAAGSEASTRMYLLFKGSETRSAVIQNYINMLEQQIAPGYINTEETNTSISDMFK